MKTCQVCGNFIFNDSYKGHNADGSVNEDFCSSCYRNGHFTRDITDSVGLGVVGVNFPMAFDNVAYNRYQK